LIVTYIALAGSKMQDLQSHDIADDHSSSAVGRFVSQSEAELTEAKNALAAALRSLQKIANTWVWA
jgi:hypothetical protein